MYVEGWVAQETPSSRRRTASTDSLTPIRGRAGLHTGGAAASRSIGMFRTSMSKFPKFSNQTTRYADARVARLGPIRVAIQRLGLPILSMRKIIGVLNAIEIQ